MTNPDSQLNYRAYLLRIWCEQPEAWRVTLQDALSGEIYHFAAVAPLVAFLQQTQSIDDNPHVGGKK
jgi:hypothetical protein